MSRRGRRREQRRRERERRRLRSLGRRWRRKVLLLLGSSLLVAVPATWQLTASRRATPGCVARIDKASFRLDHAQAASATTIAVTARKLQLPTHAITIALATALQESTLRNLTRGDRDSVGLFQQRPSKGWGRREEILSPPYAATRFYEALRKVPRWDRMTVNDAAQTVQRSGHPKAYAKWEPQARLLARALTGEAPGAFTCSVPTRRAAPFAQLNSALKAELGGKLLDVPVDPQRGWLIASWVVARAGHYGVTQVTVTDRRWTSSTSTWRPHSPRSPAVRVVHR